MQQKNYSNHMKKDTYVLGNAVKKLSVMPETVPQKHGRQDLEQEKREKRLHQKEIQRAHRINFLYTMAVVGVVAFVFTVCVQYLELQAAVNANSTTVAKMQVELNELTDKNDAMELEINGSIDYEKILNTALNELHMKYPSRNQMVNYNSVESQYAKQYADIPTAR